MEASATVASIGAARCASLHCAICADISSAARQELARLARIRTYKAGETVLAESGQISFVGNVVSGVLRMQKTLHDGRQQIVGLLLPSDMFGRVFASVSNVAIEAATDATLCCYNRASFEALFDRFRDLEHKVLISMSEELDAAQDWMLLLATQTVMERIATFLLILTRKKLASDRRSSGGRIVVVPVARKDMAAYLGTTVESISRSVQDMARRGVIRIIDAQTFEIREQRRLLDISGHDPIEFAPVPRGIRRLG
jgi:CRP/FNR family transcriptional regulator